MTGGQVVAVARRATHQLSKSPCEEITLLEGQGIEGDAHCGTTVKHRSHVKINPDEPNLRQVHLIHSELLGELAEKGFSVHSAELGENILTSGIDLLSLPSGTILTIGSANGSAKLAVTGLRSPCKQLDHFQAGLMSALIDRDEQGNIIRKSGVMAVVVTGGIVRIGDDIAIEWPQERPLRPLLPV